jgi:PleD family two-component response regulator
MLLLLPEATIVGAEMLAQRLVQGAPDWTARSRHQVRVPTLSCGISGFEGGLRDGSDWQAVVAGADRALYRAKRGGKNRVASTRRAVAKQTAGAKPAARVA